ncbi:MAG: radical SAM protein [Cytophagales bacterium]|nr:radical SAM protein [Cytophagales bacterium]
MYSLGSYLHRGLTFLNNRYFPSRKRLSTLMIYATDLCDSACKHCLIWAKRPVKHLPFETIRQLLQKNKCVSSQTLVGLEGGEFLLHPEAMEILAWMRKHHPRFDLLSNCLKPDKLIRAVEKYPPQRLYVSLDGDKDTYLYMRGKEGYDSVLSVIQTLHKRVPISVMFCLSPYNDFEDMKHVGEVSQKYGVDMRVGVYNDIAFFDTLEKAHETDIAEKKDKTKLVYKEVKPIKDKIQMDKGKSEQKDLSTPKHQVRDYQPFHEQIPSVVSDFPENREFLILYEAWRRKKLKLKCHSILDSLIVLPDGTVPICQNLDTKLGSIYQDSLDHIFNSPSSQKIQDKHVHHCNQCWINFHRKYDIVLYRTFERFFGTRTTAKLLGYYQWSDEPITYSSLMKKYSH